MLIVCYAAVLAALLIFPDTASTAAAEALSVWGLYIVPSLLPYMVFSRLLAKKLQSTPIPSWIVCALLGMLGGSPSGAALLSVCGKALRRKTAMLLFALIGTISPMFFLGTIASFTGNSVLSKKLLLCQYAGSFFAAACLAVFLPGEAALSDGVKNKETQAETASALSQGIDAILQIGGCIICCSVLASLIGVLSDMPRLPAALLHALLEISGGIHALFLVQLSPVIRNLLLAFVSGFTGLSIIAQNLLYAKTLHLHAGHLLAIALLRALGAAGTMLLIS